MDHNETNANQENPEENKPSQPTSQSAEDTTYQPMKKKKTPWFQILGVIIIIIAAIWILVALKAESVIKSVAEKAGTKTLGVNVAIDGVTLAILKGQAEINDLVIDNPEGYENPTMLEAGTIDVKLDTSTLFKGDTVVIEKILLDNITVTLEQKGLTSNINEVVNNIKSNLPDKKEPTPETEKAPGKQLMVSDLEMKNVTVKAKFSTPAGSTDTMEFKLTPIQMTNLGEKKTMDAAELTAKIMYALAQGIIQQAPANLPNQLLGSSKEYLQGAAAEKSKKIGESIMEKAGDVGKEAGKALEGLLGGKKEDQ